MMGRSPRCYIPSFVEIGLPVLEKKIFEGFYHMSLVMRKPEFCICENKDADQLRGNREADQRLCFRYIASIIPLLPKSKISSLQPSSVTAQPGLCRTRSETPKTRFLTTRLIYGHGGHLGHVTRIMLTNFHFLVPESFHTKFSSEWPSSF